MATCLLHRESHPREEGGYARDLVLLGTPSIYEKVGGDWLSHVFFLIIFTIWAFVINFLTNLQYENME